MSRWKLHQWLALSKEPDTFAASSSHWHQPSELSHAVLLGTRVVHTPCLRSVRRARPRDRANPNNLLEAC